MRVGDPGGPVQVIAVNPTFKDSGRADFKLLFAVANSEPEPGSVTRVSWQAWLQRRWFGEGEQVLAQPIAAGGVTRFDLVLPLALRRVPASTEAIRMEFVVRGELTAVIGGSEHAMPFAQTLTINAPASLSSAGAEED